MLRLGAPGSNELRGVSLVAKPVKDLLTSAQEQTKDSPTHGVARRRSSVPAIPGHWHCESSERVCALGPAEPVHSWPCDTLA
jgi:hypothetical protein